MFLAGGATAAVAVFIFVLAIEFFGLVEPRAFYMLADKGFVVLPILVLAGYQSGRAYLNIRRELKEDRMG